jgi:hypothetical protein
MSSVDVIVYALTIAALAALALLGLRVWRQCPERVTTRGLAGTAALTAVSALLAGYLLTMAQPVPRAGRARHLRPRERPSRRGPGRAGDRPRHQVDEAGRLVICDPMPRAPRRGRLHRHQGRPRRGLRRRNAPRHREAAGGAGSDSPGVTD